MGNFGRGLNISKISVNFLILHFTIIRKDKIIPAFHLNSLIISSGQLPQISNNYRCHFRFHLFGTTDFVKAITTTKCVEAVPHLESALETALLNHFEPAKRQVCTVPGPPRNRERRKIVEELAVIIGGNDNNHLVDFLTIRLHLHDNYF